MISKGGDCFLWESPPQFSKKNCIPRNQAHGLFKKILVFQGIACDSLTDWNSLDSELVLPEKIFV